MNAIQDQAICIRRQDYSESSQIVTLFSRDNGKVRGIGKGARREKGKFSGGIDLLTLGDLMFAPARGDSGLATLMEFELRENFPSIRTDLLMLNSAQFAADLIAHFTEDMDPHPELFEAFHSFLEHLPSQPNLIVALVAFQLLLFRAAGLSPAWSRCCACSRQLDESRLYFSSASGGMLCRDCEPAVMDKQFVRTVVWEILAAPSKHQDASLADAFEAHKLLCYHQRELIGKETYMTRFLNSLLRQKMNK